MRVQVHHELRDDVTEALETHDERLAERGFVAWLGAEPTYTRRESAEATWIGSALGAEKEATARRVLDALATTQPRGVVLRAVGRWYPEEAQPRFSYGIYARRDGGALWAGPPDPLQRCRELQESGGAVLDAGLGRDEDVAVGLRDGLCDALAARLRAEGHDTLRLAPTASLPLRLCVGTPGTRLEEGLAHDPRVTRPSPHLEAPEAGAARDALATAGVWLFRFHIEHAGDAAGHVRIELPAVDDVDGFCALLAVVAAAANDAGLDRLVLAGHPPPVDARMAFTTLTPDPGVLEINMAPARDARGLYAELCRIEDAALSQGLSPYRLHYNGEEGDSGGGGQITFGGPSFAQSPFVARPELLPRLLRYHLAHPSLSFLFGWERMGSGSQSPRPDESAPEALPELALTLAGLTRARNADVALVCASLAPFLSDRFGNTHRAEINVEKLAHVAGPPGAHLGLVEFRALRMGPTPAHMAARAALLQALLALLWERDLVPEVVDWGSELHDRFALPFHLERDLTAVLADLEGVGLRPSPLLCEHLLDDSHRVLLRAPLGEAELRVRAALEFPPLVGDQALQGASSRLVDASTQRVELWLSDAGAGEWSVCVDGCEMPLPHHGDDRVLGVRRRAYRPALGVHPWLAPREPLVIVLCDLGRDLAFEVVLHAWRPDGGAYSGLPTTREEAQARRAERVQVRPLGRAQDVARVPLPDRARTPHAVDARYLG